MNNSNQNKELIIENNAFILQIISMRDKVSGLYLPSMDGNVNLLLNRLYTQFQKRELKTAYITLPLIEQIDRQSLNALRHINAEFFNSGLRFVHIDCYGSNVGETRDNFGKMEYFTHHSLEFADQFVSHFPVKLKSGWLDNSRIIYDYSLTKLSLTDDSPSAKYFDDEVRLSKTFETYLFSDIQYDFWKSQDPERTGFFFRSSNMMNRDFCKKIADLTIQQHLHDEELTEDIIRTEEFMNSSETICFFPSRIDDDRYQFRLIVEAAKASGQALIITNPTNAPLPEYMESVTLLDLSNCTNKRFIYFFILTHNLMRCHDKIYHLENDMHLGMIEQILLTKATVRHPHFTEQTVKSYIHD